MSDLQTLLHMVDELDQDEFRTLYEYMVESRSRHHEAQEDSVRQPRVLGLHAHLGPPWLSEDFDAPLRPSRRGWINSMPKLSTSPISDGLAINRSSQDRCALNNRNRRVRSVNWGNSAL